MWWSIDSLFPKYLGLFCFEIWVPFLLECYRPKYFPHFLSSFILSPSAEPPHCYRLFFQTINMITIICLLQLLNSSLSPAVLNSSFSKCPDLLPPILQKLSAPLLPTILPQCPTQARLLWLSGLPAGFCNCLKCAAFLPTSRISTRTPVKTFLASYSLSHLKSKERITVPLMVPSAFWKFWISL